MATIAEVLKGLRKETRVSQREVAEAIGLNERNYRRYEAGEIEPSATNINKLADYFEVTADYLLGRTDKRK